MILTYLILVPFIGIFLISTLLTYNITFDKIKLLKVTALGITIIDLIISLVMFILYDNSSKNFQFIQEHFDISYYEFYLGIDGLSIFFVLLTALIMPISVLSNWKSIKENTTIFLLIILLLEASLLTVFLILDILMFYIFFESILAPLFILIGVYGSNEKVRASFYFFLYTLLGSLFMLLSIISVLSQIGSTSFDILSKTNFVFISQIFLFLGIIIAFAVKTPVIYLNSWLLKAHVESPLSGSIILAAIVLKLSLYGIFRLILVLLPKAFIYYTYVIFVIGVLTIIYASLSTLRTVDVKELIAYSSVSHAAVYLIGVFSNTFQGIQGAVSLGLAHGFVSSGLFTCAGGVLYDRSSTRLITYYRGIAQIMPVFCILFFILSLGNCGVPLTLNFLGEFLSLYGVFERLPMSGILASSSIVFSAAYTIFMYNRISFAGSFFLRYWDSYLPDVNKREFFILLSLVIFTVFLGIYPAILLDGLNYSSYCLLYSIDSISSSTINFEEPTLFSDYMYDFSYLNTLLLNMNNFSYLNNLFLNMNVLDYMSLLIIALFAMSFGIKNSNIYGRLADHGIYIVVGTAIGVAVISYFVPFTISDFLTNDGRRLPIVYCPITDVCMIDPGYSECGSDIVSYKLILECLTMPLIHWEFYMDSIMSQNCDPLIAARLYVVDILKWYAEVHIEHYGQGYDLLNNRLFLTEVRTICALLWKIDAIIEFYVPGHQPTKDFRFWYLGDWDRYTSHMDFVSE